MSHLNGGSVLSKEFPKAARRETEATQSALKDMIEQFSLMVTQIVFPAVALAPAPGALLTTFAVEVHDVNDIKMLFGDNVAPRVQVDEAGGTAVGAQLSGDGVNFAVAGVIIPLKKGQGTVYARATGVGTVVATLVDVDATGLILGANAVVTFA